MAKKMKFVKTKTAIFFASDSSRLTPTWLLLFFTNRKSRMYKGRVAEYKSSMTVRDVTRIREEPESNCSS